MAKISVIGIAGNSIFMNVDHFHKKGETVNAQSVYEEIGGKGFNQALTCAKMGAEVSFLCAVGEDVFAKQCEQSAKQYQVTGFRDAELSVDDVALFEKEIADSDILLLQNEVPCEVNEAAIKLANKYGVRVILNPAPIRSISENIAKSVFAVTPNEHEQSAIDTLRFKNVITTLGSKGCLINGETNIQALKVKAVDTTGAGDTFNGVLAVCLADGMDIQTACKYATVASGISVTKNGVLNAIPTKEEIERKMKHE